MVNVLVLSGVYASGVKLSAGVTAEISDNDYRILSEMKKVELVKEAKKKGAKKAAKKKS